MIMLRLRASTNSMPLLRFRWKRQTRTRAGLCRGKYRCRNQCAASAIKKIVRRRTWRCTRRRLAMASAGTTKNTKARMPGNAMPRASRRANETAKPTARKNTSTILVMNVCTREMMTAVPEGTERRTKKYMRTAKPLNPPVVTT